VRAAGPARLAVSDFRFNFTCLLSQPNIPLSGPQDGLVGGLLMSLHSCRYVECYAIWVPLLSSRVGVEASAIPLLGTRATTGWHLWTD
jgi:hypothetical protein